VITGDFAVQTDTFTVTVTLTPVGTLTLNANAIDAGNGEKGIDNDRNYTITYTVTGDSEYTIKNIPYDVNYTVVETGLNEYTPEYVASYDGNQVGKIEAASTSTTITNTRNAEINTGINLDSLPYLIILAVAIGGLILFVTRRRMASNE
ncbi:MAG: hypothetical protein GX783_14600, partial [Clostridiales bacterium]|nr:hypothetical protein [Clostridiales bacterium]